MRRLFFFIGLIINQNIMGSNVNHSPSSINQDLQSGLKDKITTLTYDELLMERNRLLENDQHNKRQITLLNLMFSQQQQQMETLINTNEILTKSNQDKNFEMERKNQIIDEQNQTIENLQNNYNRLSVMYNEIYQQYSNEIEKNYKLQESYDIQINKNNDLQESYDIQMGINNNYFRITKKNNQQHSLLKKQQQQNQLLQNDFHQLHKQYNLLLNTNQILIKINNNLYLYLLSFSYVYEKDHNIDEKYFHCFKSLKEFFDRNFPESIIHNNIKKHKNLTSQLPENLTIDQIMKKENSDVERMEDENSNMETMEIVNSNGGKNNPLEYFKIDQDLNIPKIFLKILTYVDNSLLQIIDLQGLLLKLNGPELNYEILETQWEETKKELENTKEELKKSKEIINILQLQLPKYKK